MYIVTYDHLYIDSDFHPNRNHECCVFYELDRAIEFIENHLTDSDTDCFEIYEAKEMKYTTDIHVTIK